MSMQLPSSFCRDDRTRTCDLVVPNHAFYQLNYIPIMSKNFFLLKRKDSNLQRHTAAALPETKYLLLLTYIRCKRFFISPPYLPFHHASMFFQRTFFCGGGKTRTFTGLFMANLLHPTGLPCYAYHYITASILLSTWLDSNQRLYGFADHCLRPLDHRCISTNLDGIRTRVS